MRRNLCIISIVFVLFWGFGFSSNLSFQNISNVCDNISFKIISNKYFENKIEFDYYTNKNNFTIEYWIEDSNHTIIKAKRNTTSLSTKNFTPKENSTYYMIESFLYVNNCKIFDAINVTNNITRIIKNETIILNNISNATINTNISANITDKCLSSFSIIPSQNITEDKIKFKFDTNSTNFTIEYWIEDFKGNIVKSKINTTNENIKTYTPKDYTNLYWIRATMYENQCIYNDASLVTFYYDKTTQCDIENSDSSDDDAQDYSDAESYIKITNKEDLEDLSTNVLNYEIYRGDTSKRVVYIYLNGQKISSVELSKYSKVKGTLQTLLIQGLNQISLSGIDVKDELSFNNNETIKKEVDIQKALQSSSSKVNVFNLNLNKSKIFFNLNITESNLQGECYINFVRTKISDVFTFETQNKSAILYNPILTLNLTKMYGKEELEYYPLKLTCKYQKAESNYYTYESLEFNYTKNLDSNNNKENSLKQNFDIEKSGSKEEESEIILNEDISMILSQMPSLKTVSGLQTKNIQTNSVEAKNNKNSSANEYISSYVSQNVSSKKNSFFFVFLGVSILLIIFILKW